MDSLYPYSSVVGLVEKCLSDVGGGGGDSSVLSSLSALLRHVPYRPDLFSIYSSLSASNKLKLKLVSYQLAIRNRDDQQLILLFNQALKDLSHSCWNISMLALQFLFIPAFDEIDENLDEKVDKTVLEESTLSFIKDSSTRRAALSALGYIEDWSRWRDVICRTVCVSGDLLSCVRLLHVTVSFSSASSHSSNILARLTNQLSALDSGFDLTTSVILLDILDIATRHRPNFEKLESFSPFLQFLQNLESSTQISSRLYFAILKFTHVTKLANESAFCYHVLRQTDQEFEIADILSGQIPLTDRTVTLLINTESCDIHVSLIKFHRHILTNDNFLQIWEILKFDLCSANQNGAKLLSANQLAVSVIYTVLNFSDGFNFLTNFAESFDEHFFGDYILAILWACPKYFDEISNFLVNQKLSREHALGHVVIRQAREQNQTLKFDQLSPRVAEILQNSELKAYWSG